MSLLATFERSHLKTFIKAAETPLPKESWRTPDGRWWTPQQVLRGWNERISDHWACLYIHYWVVTQKVDIEHVPLPARLRAHNADDPAWAHIEATFGGSPEQREPNVVGGLGRADLVCTGRVGGHETDDAPSLMVEFGGCSPAKFALNLGLSCGTHWMIVPYDCPYAFVFIPKEHPLLAKRSSVL